MSDYDTLLEDYEKKRIVPVAQRSRQSFPLSIYSCPWCGLGFWAIQQWDENATGEKASIVHCPYCCMEVKLP